MLNDQVNIVILEKSNSLNRLNYQAITVKSSSKISAFKMLSVKCIRVITNTAWSR